jgi:hypothetical protein
MTAAEARADRARLETEVDNAVAAGARARNAGAKAASDVHALQQELTRLQVQHARQGESKELSQQIVELANRLSVAQRAVITSAANVDNAARGERDARTELGFLLIDNLGVFARDAQKFSEAAQGQLAALAEPIAQAQTAWQAAQLEWARLSSALRDTLQDVDEKRGVYAPMSRYSVLIKMPPFPYPPVGEIRAAPAGVALLSRPAKAAA